MESVETHEARTGVELFFVTMPQVALLEDIFLLTAHARSGALPEEICAKVCHNFLSDRSWVAKANELNRVTLWRFNGTVGWITRHDFLELCMYGHISNADMIEATELLLRIAKDYFPSEGVRVDRFLQAL